MRELRHDFRAVYRLRYEDVPTAEAIDLIKTLPPGSMYVAATDPLRAWSESRHHAADVVDALSVVAWTLGAYDETVTEPPRVTRPRDVLARELERARRDRATATLEDGGWEEM